jgi:hypothetical protein
MYDFLLLFFDAGRRFLGLFFFFFASILLTDLYPFFHAFVRI